MGITWQSYDEDKSTIHMQALPCDCHACGRDATGLNLGIPVYEDFVLPNDWAGEWFGVPACDTCFAKQEQLTEPQQVKEFLEASPPLSPRKDE